MKEVVSFTDSDISDFCIITEGDNYNDLHNSKFMREKHELPPIVPGMLTFTYAANLAGDFLKKNANLIEVYFNLFLSSGEPVTPEIDYDKKSKEAKLSAKNNDNNDLLCSEEGLYSRLCKIEKPKYQLVEGTKRTFYLGGREGIYSDKEKGIERFAQLIDTGKEDIVVCLLAVASSSKAFLQSAYNPKNSTEEMIGNQIESNNLPVYTSLRIVMPEGHQDINPLEEISYTIKAEEGKEKRDFILYADCRQEEHLIYSAVSTIKIIPEKVIIRTAKRRFAGLDK